MPRRFAVLAFILVLAASALDAAERVVAIGDVHGEYEGFVSILQKAQLIDSSLRWSGGRTTFVQTGDFFDRGPDVRRVLDLMMKLESGWRHGRVIVLLGNHEVMNLAGVTQDINPAAYAAFGDGRSERRRQDAWRNYGALQERLAKRYPPGSIHAMSESEWMQAHPPGFIEYHASLARGGKYGRWLRTKPIMAKVGGTVFVHGGISPSGDALPIDRMNARARLEIEGIDRVREYLVAQKLILPFFTYEEVLEVARAEAKRTEGVSDEMRKIVDAANSMYRWSVMDGEGPLWFRGFAEWGEEEGAQTVTQLLGRFDARRFVVGHTIPPDAHYILPRFGGKVVLIDTGMLRGYAKNGRPSALEIVDDKLTAIYESERITLDASSPRGVEPAGERGASWLGPDGVTLPFRSAADVVEFLRNAHVVSIDSKKLSGATHPQRVVIENNGVRARAVFRALHREEENAKWEDGTFTEFLRDSYRSEIAAYQLAVLLGLDTVPPTVPWELNGEQGALQIWIEKARPGFHPNGVEKPRDPERWQLELELMRPFDALVANLDRHFDNMLVDSREKVWWIDHSRCFGRTRELLKSDLLGKCDRTFWEKLKAVDPKTIADTMAPYMSAKEIDALLARRELLIQRIEALIAERGEAAVLVSR